MSNTEHTYLHIECLSPVHIGDGLTRKGLQELLLYSGDREKKAYGSTLLAIADPRKLMERTPGQSPREKALRLSAMVEKGEDLLRQFAFRGKSPFPSEVASKALVYEGKGVSWNSDAGFVGMLQSGRGLPMLPASSLKGAMVTGIFASQVSELKHRPWKEGRPIRFFPLNNQGRVQNSKDQPLWESVFGKNPNESFLRYLRLSDAEFTQSRAFGSSLLNLRNRGWVMDEGKALFVEGLPSGAQALIRHSFPKRQEQHNRYFKTSKAWPYPKWEDLANLLNTHTQRLIKEELAFINKYTSPLLAPLQESLIQLLEKAQHAPSGHCLLRLGYGSGWRFMTGFWQEKLFDNEELQRMYDKVCRYGHTQKETPKTRRVLGDGTPMGFIWIRPGSQAEASRHQKNLETQAQLDPMAAYGPFEEKVQLEFTPYPLKKRQEVKAMCLGPVQDKPGHKLFELYVGKEDGSEKQRVSLRYPSNALKEGMPVILRLQDVDRHGNKVLAVSFRKML